VAVTTTPCPPLEPEPDPPFPPVAVICTLVTPAGTVTVLAPAVVDENSSTDGAGDAPATEGPTTSGAVTPTTRPTAPTRARRRR
jgi:hypothetical protein